MTKRLVILLLLGIQGISLGWTILSGVGIQRRATAPGELKAGLNFSTSSARFIAIIWIVGIIAFIVTVLLSMQVLAIRQRNLRRERRREALITLWRPLLFEALLGGAPKLQKLARRDEGSFLLLWIQLQEGIRGESRQRLNALAETIGADDMARRLLKQKGVLERVFALCVLGYLGREQDYPRVSNHLDEPRTYLALAAARALVFIDPRKAPYAILPRLVLRSDWPVALFATVLAEADQERLSERFLALFAELSAEQLIRLLPLATILNEKTAEEILKTLLARGSEPEVIAAALKQVRSVSLLDHVRRACTHEMWAIRTQAAAALGRIGGMADRELLLRLLCDPQWWVRYRAAQALISGSFGSPHEIASLAAEFGDRFAVDIVEHAIAERRA